MRSFNRLLISDKKIRKTSQTSSKIMLFVFHSDHPISFNASFFFFLLLDFSLIKPNKSVYVPEDFFSAARRGWKLVITQKGFIY